MRKNKPWLKYLIVTFFILVLMFILALFQPANIFDRSAKEVAIPNGASTKTIQTILEDSGIIKPESTFTFAAKVLGMTQQIKAGEYLLSPSDNLLDVLLKLKRGEVKPPDQLRVTFPEGASIYRMGEILKDAGYDRGEQFKKLVHEGISEDLRQKYWHIFKYIPSESLEGYLYPDTYLIGKEESVKTLSWAMVSRFDKVVMPFWKKAKNDTKMTLHEVLTLASIIEKEAQKSQERPIISSVFHNRLKARMYLAACPTIKYALDKPTRKVYLDQLEVDSPYNTYKRKGLPPGPVCNPGIESIRAAVYPAKTNYYFFVANKDGSHIFSKDWQGHQKARFKTGQN